MLSNLWRMTRNLVLPLLKQAQWRPDHLALEVGEARFSYGQLADQAGAVAGWIEREVEQRTGRVAILASRTPEAYLGALGTAWAGATYVPVNPHWPASRIDQLLSITKPDAIIADAVGLKAVEKTASAARVLAPGFHLGQDRAGRNIPEPAAIASDQTAYIIFTSGSTGIPKGVCVSNANVNAFLATMRGRYDIEAHDRLSQASELTFDVSVFDMFMAWSAGASLHVVPKSQLMGPRDFIREKQISVWFSVPSIAILMQQLKMLAPGAFPRLRHSLFAGEALPAATAIAWRDAAPNSSVENLYGPTEATVVCLGCEFKGEEDITPGRGIVATGRPFDGVIAAILDANLRPVETGTPGQLAVAGPQIAQGYLDDDELTARRFPEIGDTRWYLTGDLASVDAHGVYHHLGRIDNQVKVNGHRVELEEIESRLRLHAGSDAAVAVPWPYQRGSARGIVAFVADSLVPLLQLQQALRRELPSYMVPGEIRNLDKLPLGPTGKFDRKALTTLLEQDASQEQDS